MKLVFPDVVASSQGREFDNKLNAELMKLMGIDYRLTTRIFYGMLLSVLVVELSINGISVSCNIIYS